MNKAIKNWTDRAWIWTLDTTVRVVKEGKPLYSPPVTIEDMENAMRIMVDEGYEDVKVVGCKNWRYRE